jgi:hypothetical protein
MKNSEQLNELFSALSKAQEEKDFAKEHALTRDLLKKPFRSNQNKSLIERFFCKIAFASSGCWLWIGGLDGDGYGLIGHKPGRRTNRVSWSLFNGEIPGNKLVLHKCDERCCVNPEHLFLGTHLDNVRDMIQKERAKFPRKMYGEENPISVLCENTVREIRLAYRRGKVGYKTLANKFGVSPSSISRVVKNETWRMVK